MKYWKLSPWDWEWNRISIITLLFSIVLKSFSQSIQLLSWVRLFAIPWTAGRQASLSSTNSWSLLKLMSIESVMPSCHLIYYPLLLLPSIFPSIRVFSNEPVLHIRWPKYWRVYPVHKDPKFENEEIKWSLLRDDIIVQVKCLKEFQATY